MRSLVLGAALGILTLNAPAVSAAPPIQEGTAVAADGTQIFYRIAGRGDDVVLAPFAALHGTKLDMLANANRKIVTYDPRGRGRSQAVPPERVSLDLLLSDLEAVRRAIGAAQVSIIGWSGGGMETFVYALRNPTRVKRLVQLAPIGPRANSGEAMMQDRQRRMDQAALAQYREEVKAGAFNGREAERCRAEAAITNPPTLADPKRTAELPDVCGYENEWGSKLGPYFGALMTSFGNFDWRPEMAKVKVPRLVIHGAWDNIPLASSEEWVRGAANAQLVVIDDAGHWPHYEQPKPTLEAIAHFLDGDWPPEAKSLD